MFIQINWREVLVNARKAYSHYLKWCRETGNESLSVFFKEHKIDTQGGYVEAFVRLNNNLEEKA